MKNYQEGEKLDINHVTIFHKLLKSDIDPQEKSVEHLAHEAQVFLAAGLETTALALAYRTFHITNNPEVNAKLWKKLEEAMPSPSAPVDWPTFDQFPYLSGCVKESIRMSYGRRSPSQGHVPFALCSGTWEKTRAAITRMCSQCLHLLSHFSRLVIRTSSQPQKLNL
jgi:hypothetical protein